MQVLTNPALLCGVTSFITGWPQLIHEFQRNVLPKHPSLDSKDQANRFRQEVGLLPHVAIAENNRSVLELLLRLHQRPDYKAMPRVHFGRVLGCAACFSRMELFEVAPGVRDPTWPQEQDLLKHALGNAHLSVELLRWLCAHHPKQAGKIDQWFAE